MNSDNHTINTTLSHERQLIGCVLLLPEIIDDLDDISPSDFLDSNCSTIYSGFVKLYESGTPIDITSVNNLVSLPDFLVECMTEVSAPSNFAYYAKIVKERSTLRKLHNITSNVSVKSNNAESSPEELIDYINQNLGELYTTKSKDTVSAKEASDDIMADILYMMENPNDVTGTTTGFPSVDVILNGLHPTDLIILAARPGRGKSAFALQLAKNVSLYGKLPTLFFSLEMGTKQLMERMVASESKVSVKALTTGRIADIEKTALKKALETIGFLPLFFNDKPGVKLKDMRKQIKAYNHKNKIPLGFIIVDYLQLMTPSNSGRENATQAMTEISRGLKIIAKEFNCCVLALSQFSRDVEKRGGKPRLSDLRDSGSLEQDADIVMFLHTDQKELDSYGNKDIELIVEKHRNGPTGNAFFSFKGSTMTFTETQDVSKWID